MKSFLILFFIFGVVACNNKVDTQVPSNIEVDVKDSTQTVNVIHTIGLSLQMESFFRTSCVAQIDKVTPGLPEPQRTQSIDACVAASSQKFIDDFMFLIKQGMSQQNGGQ